MQSIPSVAGEDSSITASWRHFGGQVRFAVACQIMLAMTDQIDQMSAFYMFLSTGFMLDI